MIHDCIREDRFIISKNENRKENIDFINEYNLSSRRQKEILLRVKTEDFCYSLQNTKIGFEHEVLYVFCPQVVLFNFDDNEELVDIYTKFNLLWLKQGNCRFFVLYKALLYKLQIKLQCIFIFLGFL